MSRVTSETVPEQAHWQPGTAATSDSGGHDPGDPEWPGPGAVTVSLSMSRADPTIRSDLRRGPGQAESDDSPVGDSDMTRNSDMTRTIPQGLPGCCASSSKRH